MDHYIAHQASVPVLKHRLSPDISAAGYSYSEPFTINGVRVSFHPAGHILGSAQVRVEYKGEIWVASGDYKLQDDHISPAFEPVKCHTFITESTFGLPVYRWQPQEEVFAQVNEWWSTNASRNKASVLLGYSLGKAQRLLQNVDHSIGPVYTHGAIDNINQLFIAQGIALKPSERVTPLIPKSAYRNALIIAPTSAINSPWLRRFEPYSLGIASGWMALRGARRRRAADRGFVLSDHADWNELNTAIRATGAEKVYVTHGYTSAFARWLQENGTEAWEARTEYEGELAEISGQAEDTQENQEAPGP
jgi:putative mRNA 3-end processing factor